MKRPLQWEEKREEKEAAEEAKRHCARERSDRQGFPPSRGGGRKFSRSRGKEKREKRKKKPEKTGSRMERTVSREKRKGKGTEAREKK